MVKVTYSLDEETVERIRRAAARLGKAQSHVVREAVAEYEARVDLLSEGERQTLLAALDEIARAPATRSARAVSRELDLVRTSRRAGGRRS